MAAAASMGEPSLRVVGLLGPDFLHGPQGAQFCGAAAGSGEQSLWAVGVLHGLQGAQFSGTATSAGGTKPAGLHLLLPVERQEPWVLLTQGR
jgi:hypothetical protein